MLEAYKNQDTVERRFPLLKDPKLVGPIYAKRDEQAEVHVYVLILALLIYSIIERRVRASLTEAHDSVGPPAVRPRPDLLLPGPRAEGRAAPEG